MRPAPALLACIMALAPLAAARDDSPAPRPPHQEQTVTGGPATLSLSLDPGTVNVAQRVRLVLRASTPNGYSLTFPVGFERIGDFAVVDRREQPAAISGGSLVHAVEYILEPFLPGTYDIPPLEVGYSRVGGGDSGTISTRPVQVRVVSLIEGDAEPGPIRGIISPASRWWLGAAGLVLAGGIIAGAAGIVVTRRRRPRPESSPGAELRDLSAALERGDVAVRGACDRGASLLRLALQARIPGAAAMTTEQLLGASSSIGLTAHERAQVREFLVRCDEVRFAGAEADAASLAGELAALSDVAAALTAPRGGAS